MSIEDKIWILAHSSNPEDKREWAVLYWKSQGLKHEEIGEKWGYSIKWVQRYMTSAYKRFEVPPQLNKYEKILYLEQNVFPLMRKFIANEPDSIKELPAPPTEEAPDEEPEQTGTPIGVAPSENKKPKEPPIIDILHPKKLSPPRDPWKTFRRVFFGVVSLLIVSGVGYYAYKLGVGNRPAPDIIVITATFPPTPESTATPIIPTDTLIPTDIPTAIPTNTQIPTTTPVPTEFIPPADGILFQDNFDGSMSVEWVQMSGTWIVDNNRLTKLPYTGSGWKFETVFLNKPEWKNFTVSMDIDRPSSNNWDEVVVVVGRKGPQLLGIQIEDYIFWGFIDLDSYQSTIPLTGDREYKADVAMNVEISVNNGVYSFGSNGRIYQTINLQGYPSEGIMIGVDCYNTLTGCTRIDNIKVTYLP